MEEKNELNDIILNKGNSAGGSKKVILAVATLGVILIIVIMLMNTLSSNGTNNLPQAVVPPEVKPLPTQVINDEPLFEEVKVIQEDSKNNDSLNEIAQKLKEESIKEKTAPAVVDTPTVETVKKPAPSKVVEKELKKPKINNSDIYYIQVGSFSKYEPNKKFLDSILTKGYKYKYHKVSNNSKTLTKVLVGPFHTEKEARTALIVIRSDIEAGAFLTRI